MAFATKYKVSKVLIGVFIATVLNHGLAVAFGNIIARNQSLEVWVQSIASLSFILFGLWTIRGDQLEGEENRKTRFGAIMTVGIAFFIAELGDKTQLATIALATKFPNDPIGILMGTTTGMVIADAIGIIIGVVMCKNIPAKTIKLVSAGAFIFFGFIGSYQTASEKLGINLNTTMILLFILAIITGIAAFFLIRKSIQLEAQNPVVAAYCRDKTLTSLPHNTEIKS
jgi:putative Ca2+/H+ antiporter (TMEM165/GDT1 family)